MQNQPGLSPFARLWLAFIAFWRIIFYKPYAQAVAPIDHAFTEGQPLPLLPASVSTPTAAPTPAPEVRGAPRPKPAEVPPEQQHASGLFVLAMLQREGRLVDFLQENVAAFSDAEVGAAARIVHEGCRKVLNQYLSLAPVLSDAEGAHVRVEAGFDAQRVRLTGNVTGSGPYAGSLKHHGWVATEIRLPAPNLALDTRVIAPAEVELP